MENNKFYTCFPISLSIFLGGLIALSSCSLIPRYSSPQVTTPATWKAETEVSLCSPQQNHWWEIFDDQRLNSLILTALENNRDLASAWQSVQQAKAIAGVNSSELYPQINVDLGYAKKNYRLEYYSPPGTPIFPNFRVQSTSYQFPFNLFYEIDLWGKLKARSLAACYDYQAEEFALSGMFLILSSQVALNYYQISILDAKIDLFQKMLEVREKILEVNQERYEMGLSSYYDVATAKNLLSNNQYLLYKIKEERVIKENSLAVLLGIPASLFTLQHHPLSDPPPSVPPCMPSDLLCQRPDIQEAERKSAAQNCRIGEAYASFFPSISLTGALGFLSPEFRNFISSKGGFASYQAEASQDIFNGFRNISNVQLSYANFRKASAHYQQTVLRAFEEVESALSKVQYTVKEYEAMAESVESAKEASELSKDRYLKGLTIFLEVADSERMELNERSEFIEILGQRYIATIELIKAIGGTWR